MSDLGIRRTVGTLSICLGIATLVAGVLSIPGLHASWPTALVLVLANSATLAPLVAQIAFLILQSTPSGRKRIPSPLGKGDGWLLVIVLSCLPSIFERSLASLASPALLTLNTPPSLPLKLGAGLFLLRLVQTYYVVRAKTSAASSGGTT